ncbi:Alpha/Beta hydrolase protein [Mycena olivaceomarginata]|nr:Alpha/Beta hydrolase protein [Mycena olivaceomarginata]
MDSFSSGHHTTIHGGIGGQGGPGLNGGVGGAGGRAEGPQFNVSGAENWNVSVYGDLVTHFSQPGNLDPQGSPEDRNRALGAVRTKDQAFQKDTISPPLSSSSISTAARVSNINSATTKAVLLNFFQSKGLAVALRQHTPLVADANGLRTLVISFADELMRKRALSLPSAERILDDRVLDFDDGFQGFTVLSEGTQVDIVALHGLNGHAFRSWEYRDPNGKESFMWLRDCLPEQIPEARVMTYGYNANVYSDVSTGRLRTFAETFLQELRYMRESDPSRPLILVGHSMGGLLVKQALLVAHARVDRRFDSILNSVTGVAFLGTPHQGANGISNAKFVANFVRAFKPDARVDLLKSLDPKSMILFDLTDDFRQLVSSKGIEIASLFETRKTKMVGSSKIRFFGPDIWIVEERSAILGVLRERKAAIDANHSNLCKFRGPTDNSLNRTLQFLKEFCRDVLPMISTRHHHIQPSPPEDLKYVALSDPEKLEFSQEYPVLILGQYTYWALSYIDNRYAMAILAYNDSGKIVGRWSKEGARYVHRIDLDAQTRNVSFIGQGNLSVVFSLSELKVTSSTSIFGL